ncbi:MAG: GNAT family N-acetyltransferase [Anaerolineaceae bacterium]|nr:GNAT family N-acetyltransferase [Anaerolineaceae bacterium]
MDRLTMRPYQCDEDYWQIRAFMREVYLGNNRREIGWQASRFDYWRWHMVENVQIVDLLENAIFLWETEAGRLVAVLNADSQTEAILTIHPDFLTPELEADMLTVAEQHLGTPGQPFFAFLHERTPARQPLLQQLGYTVGKGKPEHQWRRDLTLPLPAVALREGYAVRPINDLDSGEWQQRSWVSWRAFHPDEPDTDYEGWEWSLNWKRSPLYRRDLDIVATTPDQRIAAYCVLWLDDVTRTALFDPVAVMPEYQRLGLGRGIMLEAMHHAQAMGAVLATVSGYDAPANALYRSLFPDCDLNTPWVKFL